MVLYIITLPYSKVFNEKVARELEKMGNARSAKYVTVRSSLWDLFDNRSHIWCHELPSYMEIRTKIHPQNMSTIRNELNRDRWPYTCTMYICKDAQHPNLKVIIHTHERVGLTTTIFA